MGASRADTRVVWKEHMRNLAKTESLGSLGVVFSGPRRKTVAKRAILGGVGSLVTPIVALWVLQNLWLLPFGDTPSNDDWMYASMVKRVLQEGRYVQHPYLQPASLVHVLWGALFSALLGLSYVSLRLSTLTLSLIGAIAAAQCARQCGATTRMSVVVGILVLGNPVYMYLGNTYMTDVPYLTWSTISAGAYLAALRRPSPWTILAGTAVGVAAFFVRQFGIFPVAAYGISVVILAGLGVRRPSRAEMFAYFIPLCFGGVIYLWWDTTRTVRFEWPLTFFDAPITTRALVFLAYALAVFTLSGFFIAPLSLARAVRLGMRRERLSVLRWCVFVALVLSFTLFWRCCIEGTLPLLGNCLLRIGIGIRLIQGHDEWYTAHAKSIAWIWTFITHLGVVSLALFVATYPTLSARRKARSIGKSRRTAPRSHARAIQLSFLGAWAMMVFVSSYTPLVRMSFDRYTLPLIVPMAIIVAIPYSGYRVRLADNIAFGLALILFSISVLCVEDYLKWNDTRWKAIEYAEQELGATPATMDGGFEYNGSRIGEARLEAGISGSFWQEIDRNAWTPNDTFRIAPSPLAGYEQCARMEYHSWLGFRRGDIFVLRRVQVLPKDH